MRIRQSRPTSFAASLLVVCLSGCSGGAEPGPPAVESRPEAPIDVASPLGEALTFHASFDNGLDADWALGDGQIYTAPSYEEQDQAAPLTGVMAGTR